MRVQVAEDAVNAAVFECEFVVIADEAAFIAPFISDRASFSLAPLRCGVGEGAGVSEDNALRFSADTWRGCAPNMRPSWSSRPCFGAEFVLSDESACASVSPVNPSHHSPSRRTGRRSR